MERIYDVVIIGGGPGGYSAALYAARAGLKTLVLEKLSAGGQMALTTQIDNYPGFDEGIDGFELGERMSAQAERFGAETVLAEVTALDLSGNPKTLETSEGTICGKTVILAMGATPKPLGVEGETELIGRGINYCAACDGMFYKGKTVAVVGGGNSAVADALVLSRIAKEVILIHRRDTLRATKIYHQALNNAPNLTIRWNTRVERLIAKDRLSGLGLVDTVTGESSQLNVDGVFVSVGRSPATGLVAHQLELDESGYILADETTKTSLPGVFAVGDLRSKAVRQVITAASDGAVAAHFAEQYLIDQ